MVVAAERDVFVSTAQVVGVTLSHVFDTGVGEAEVEWMPYTSANTSNFRHSYHSGEVQRTALESFARPVSTALKSRVQNRPPLLIQLAPSRCVLTLPSFSDSESVRAGLRSELR